MPCFLDNEQNFKYYLDSLGKPFKSDKLNVRAFKFFADGSLGSRGACLLNPYNDEKILWNAFTRN